MGTDPLFKLSFDTGVAINVDVNSVQCRAYTDTAGTQPLGQAFSAEQAAVYSTPEKPVMVGSVLCYVAWV